MAFRGIVTVAVTLVALQWATAVDGVSVTCASRWADPSALDLVPEMDIAARTDAENNPGRIIRLEIRNSSVVSCDTIYKRTFARFPVLNLDGTRVAFQRWGARIDDGRLVDTDRPNHISAMDLDGGNVHDLVEYSDPTTLIDWSRDNGEDWIYYTRRNALEVWKVKPHDASSNTRACSYGADAVWGMLRWDVSADGSRAMVNYIFSDGSSVNVPHQLPFTSMPLPGTRGGTSEEMSGFGGTISPSGRYVAAHSLYGHRASTIARWDPGAWHWGDTYMVVTMDEMSESLGVDAGYAMEMHRWSSNSDKWMCVSAAGGYEPRWQGGNQVLVNWVDREFVMTTNNEYKGMRQMPVVYSCVLGDFHVTSPEGMEGCCEDSLGNWSPMGEGVWANGDRLSVEGYQPAGTDHWVDEYEVSGRCIRRARSSSARGFSPGEGSRGVVVMRTTGSAGQIRTLRVVR